jgi:hypothetical protein
VRFVQLSFWGEKTTRSADVAEHHEATDSRAPHDWIFFAETSFLFSEVFSFCERKKLLNTQPPDDCRAQSSGAHISAD